VKREALQLSAISKGLIQRANRNTVFDMPLGEQGVTRPRSIAEPPALWLASLIRSDLCTDELTRKKKYGTFALAMFFEPPEWRRTRFVR
jgi:hypothetical protein